MARDTLRHAFERTIGNDVSIYNHDIFTVTAVVTEKYGPALILLVRGGAEVWIKDNPRHRWLLDMASGAESLASLKGMPETS